MVVLIMAVTALTAMTALALQTWTSIAQREREEELIFRGLQYAEAIRVFQRRFGRYPVRLEELIKVKPRCIRQLYPDPMNEDGDWGLIFATGNNRRNGRPQQQRAEAESKPEDSGGTLPQSSLKESSNLFAKKKQAVGPISGVHSKASAEVTYKVFMDQEQYEQWAFTVDLVSGVSNTPDRPPQIPSARTLGRPFKEGVTPLISFTQANNRQGGGGGNRGRPPVSTNPNQNPGTGNGGGIGGGRGGGRGGGSNGGRGGGGSGGGSGGNQGSDFGPFGVSDNLGQEKQE